MQYIPPLPGRSLLEKYSKGIAQMHAGINTEMCILTMVVKVKYWCLQNLKGLTHSPASLPARGSPGAHILLLCR